MWEDKALQYEHLIKTVFKCDRYGVAGANADIYRTLEREASIAASERVDRFELGVCMGRVAAYLENALKTTLKERSDDEESTKKIRECLSLLQDPTMQNIDECIDKALEVLNRSEGLLID